MSIIDPSCGDIGRWRIADGHGVCPDCADVVPDRSIPEHVDWHAGLRTWFFGAEAPPEPVVERFGEASSEIVRLLHALQVAGLRAQQGDDPPPATAH